MGEFFYALIDEQMRQNDLATKIPEFLKFPWAKSLVDVYGEFDHCKSGISQFCEAEWFLESWETSLFRFHLPSAGLQ